MPRRRPQLRRCRASVLSRRCRVVSLRHATCKRRVFHQPDADERDQRADGSCGEGWPLAAGGIDDYAQEWSAERSGNIEEEAEAGNGVTSLMWFGIGHNEQEQRRIVECDAKGENRRSDVDPDQRWPGGDDRKAEGFAETGGDGGRRRLAA